MSFANNYLALRAKRLKDQQQKKEDPMPNLDSPFKLNTLVLKSPSEMEDLAPVTLPYSGEAPVMELAKEEERKWFEAGAFDDGYDFGDVTKTILGSGVDLVENVASGVLGMGETVLDSGMMLGGLAAKHFLNGTTEMLIQSDLANYKRLYGDRPKMVEEYEKKLRAKYANYGDVVDKKTTEIVAEDLYDEEKIAKTIISNPIKALTTVDADKDSVFGEKVDSLAQSGGQLAATAALQMVGVPWWLTTGATSFGSEAENALNQGASLEEAAFSAAVSAGAEILTEKISGGISFGGKTWDQGLVDALTKNISNKTVKTLAKLGIDAAGEGGEEILSGVMSAIGQQLSYREDEELFGKDGIFSTEDAFESFIGGAVLGGGSSLISSVQGGKQNKKPDTLKPDTEQKVVDKLYNDAIAEAEADGKKLTQKEKQKLYDSVMNDLDKGYISTDTIEEILGGEDYKAYKDTIDNEDSLIKELDELRNMKSGEMTDIQRDRLTELKGMNLTDTTKRNGLKTKLGESVFGLVKDTRLAESYNERTRRSQAFEADLSKYDEKQAAVIQKAIDSGILNNTNRTHDFVDMVSKISADKGVLFDFANNAKLKESGFSIDGATINGFVTKDGVTLNIDSAKSLNSVVGHEITHVLEGTELYTEMQKALFDYAKSKNDYQGRYDSLSALYKGVKGADVDAELTADLVGDYLFTDRDFIHNLSTKHRNVFEKIYDEIKYLYKMATAGSKEARELEKVKRAFEVAYKENGKGVDGTSYSLSDSDGKALTNEQNEYFKDSKVRDENGNLLKVYHTTNNDFTVFDKSRLGEATGDANTYLGFFFSDDAEYLQNFPQFQNGKTDAYYLNIKNPIDMTNISRDAFLDIVEVLGGDVDAAADVYEEMKLEYGNDPVHLIHLLQETGADTNYSELIEELKPHYNELMAKGYDGVVNYLSEYRGVKEYIVLDSNQAKLTDNAKPTEDPDIRYSLSKDGEAPKQYGRYNVRGEDVKLENNIAPTQAVTEETESVEPMVDEAVDNAVDEEVAPSMRELYGEGYAPIENAYTVEQEIEGIKKEMFSLYEQYNALKDEGKDAEAQPLFDKWLDLNEQAQALNEKAEAYKAEERGYFDSLTDADDPGEADEPYSLPRGNITLSDKTVSRVTKEISKGLGLDAEDSAKMAEIVQKYAQNENMTEDELFEEIKNNFQYSEVVSSNEDILQQAKKYIRKTKLYVPDIVKGDFPEWNNFRKKHFGKFVLTNNNANLGIDQFYQELNELYPSLFPAEIGNAADQLKQIADVTDSEAETEYRYGAFDNDTIQEVVDTIVGNVRDYSQKEIQKQLDKDRRSFYKSIGAGDIAPAAEEPISTYDATDKKQVPGQQTIFEDTQAEAPTEAEPTEEPKVAELVAPTPKDQKKSNLGMKVRNILVDKQSAIEDVSLKKHNRELMAKADFMLRSESRAQRYIAKHLIPIFEKAEATGKRHEHERYWLHLHNIDRMSIESRAQARLKELEGKFAHLKPEQIRAIAATKITDKTTEKTANTIREAKEWLNLPEAKNKAVWGDSVTADKSREFAKNFEAENPEAKALAEEAIEFNKDLRQMLVDGSIVSQETADKWGQMYPHYVPIHRNGKDGAAVTVPLDSMKTGVNAPIKGATGGNSSIDYTLETMASRTQQVFRAVARNSFGLELMHTLDTVVDTQPTSVDEVLDSFESDTDELLKPGKNGANPTFTVFENGKRITFDITEELYDALKPTDGLLKADIPVMSFLTKLQRGLLTQYNPTFIVTNAIKDIQDVIVNSQHPGKTYANVPLAIKELLKGDGKWITEYMDNGGEDLTYFDSKKQVFKKEDSKVKKVLGFVPNGIAKANDFVEKAPRLAEYIASRKRGASVEVAMLDAARVTTNFAAGGDLTKFANKNGFTFLNASVQGAAQQVRNIREAKANGLKGVMQLAAKFAVAGLPIMLFNALRWDDDEDYAELSDYIKDNYYIVAKYGDGKFVRIPKGRAVAVIQSGLEQMKNLITGNDEVDMARFGQLMVENIAPNNPLDNNVIAPIWQAASNKTWYGGDLVPQRLQDLPDAEQFDETTDSISKWLGEVTGQSPYKINYLLDQYSGGIGDMILPMLTPESDSGGIVAPFADKFTTDSAMKNQNVSDFYTKVDELTKNANSAYATDDDILKSKYMNSISSELGELYAQKREIQNGDLSDEEKDAAVREIQKQIVDLTKTGLSSYENIQYEGDGEYAVIGDRYYQWYTPKNGEAYWRKLDDDQVVKYNLTKNAGNAHYVTDGNVHYRLDEDGEWTKISDRQLERQNEVTKALGITPEEYWSKTDISFLPMSDGEYEYAFENPEKYTVAKAVGGYDAFKSYSSELYDIKADKDENGKSISGSRKEKVLDYINNLDADYGTKIILFKSEYNADDTYNRDIIDYLNSRDDISYEEMETILKELGFTVDSSGNISWD